MTWKRETQTPAVAGGAANCRGYPNIKCAKDAVALRTPLRGENASARLALRFVRVRTNKNWRGNERNEKCLKYSQFSNLFEALHKGGAKAEPCIIWRSSTCESNDVNNEKKRSRTMTTSHDRGSPKSTSSLRAAALPSPAGVTSPSPLRPSRCRAWRRPRSAAAGITRRQFRKPNAPAGSSGARFIGFLRFPTADPSPQYEKVLRKERPLSRARRYGLAVRGASRLGTRLSCLPDDVDDFPGGGLTRTLWPLM